MSIPFDYPSFPPNSPNPRLRPIIKIYLSHEKLVFPTDALIDSGSDITLSYAGIGKKLGIKFDSLETKNYVESLGHSYEDVIYGLGKEEIEVFSYPIKLTIHDITENVIFRWIKHDINADMDFPVILGQDSLFSFFDVHFSRRQKKFFLNKECLITKHA